MAYYNKNEELRGWIFYLSALSISSHVGDRATEMAIGACACECKQFSSYYFIMPCLDKH